MKNWSMEKGRLGFEGLVGGRGDGCLIYYVIYF
jgi:hypothetical protein